MKYRSALGDGEKIAVTLALWAACIPLFAVAFSLYILPNEVTTVFGAEPTSKYNNLYLLLFSAIAVSAVAIVTELKRRRKTENGLLSAIAFCALLSVAFGAVTVCGLVLQAKSAESLSAVNIHALITLVACFLVSAASASSGFLHPSASRYGNKDYRRVASNAERFWDLGAYGFIVCAAASAFLPTFYCYIPLAAFFASYIILLLSFGRKELPEE